MRLLAISDLHVRYAKNLEALRGVSAHPGDWLILGGDLGETVEHVTQVLDATQPKFEKLLWVPGNHELWSSDGLKGPAKYAKLVELCRSRGVLTPEDPWPLWPGEGPKTVVCPMFTFYDYSFRPADVPLENAVEWAVESGVLCTDERMIEPAPYTSLPDWCHARVEYTRERLETLPADTRTVLVNHFPLRHDLVFIPRIPRFCIWCGTTQTEDWHLRYRARSVVYGHLHLRVSKLKDGVSFEEVSVGYPKQWQPERGIDPYIRVILAS